MCKKLFCLVKEELSGTDSKMEKWAKSNWQKPIKLKKLFEVHCLFI